MTHGRQVRQTAEIRPAAAPVQTLTLHSATNHTPSAAVYNVPTAAANQLRGNFPQDEFLSCQGEKVAHTRLPELIPVLGSQPAGDVSYKPGGRLPLLSTRPAVTLATLKRAATNFAAW